VLLEGRFESVFKNRIAPSLLNAKEVAYRDKGRNTKMIVVSDGDIIRNGFTPDGNLLPAGYDRYSGQQYANGRFIINAVNFLLDDAALTDARSRSLEIRLLDRKKAKEERAMWQAVNIAGPMIAIVFFGILWAMVRKRRYVS
jgi:gliding-associated putative ABC transporter substrate-binding component GldG